MPRLESRTLLFACATLAFLGLLAYISGGSSTAADTLPSRLSDREFWQMIVDFSEPDGYFRSDNFVSNETGYQSVIPMLHRRLQPGGVYLGVGPEQNFTYIAALQPKMAFVVDIRRQNMIEHLIYKAIFETSSSRVDFLSRLFSRKAPENLNEKSTAKQLFQAFRSVPPDADLYRENLRAVKDRLMK